MRRATFFHENDGPETCRRESMEALDLQIKGPLKGWCERPLLLITPFHAWRNPCGVNSPVRNRALPYFARAMEGRTLVTEPFPLTSPSKGVVVTSLIMRLMGKPLKGRVSPSGPLGNPGAPVPREYEESPNPLWLVPPVSVPIATRKYAGMKRHRA